MCREQVVMNYNRIKDGKWSRESPLETCRWRLSPRPWRVWGCWVCWGGVWGTWYWPPNGPVSSHLVSVNIRNISGAVILFSAGVARPLRLSESDVQIIFSPLPTNYFLLIPSTYKKWKCFQLSLCHQRERGKQETPRGSSGGKTNSAKFEITQTLQSGKYFSFFWNDFLLKSNRTVGGQ